MKNKLRVAVIFGGKSGEHEVSLRSGASVLKHLNRNSYEIYPISIDKTGRWRFSDIKTLDTNNPLVVDLSAPEVRLETIGKDVWLKPVNAHSNFTGQIIDIFFPVIHGPLCEDGTIQGLLELAGAAYVGSGVLGSSIGMDKDISKKLAKTAGVPVAPYLCFSHQQFSQTNCEREVKANLSLPVFVKPANMGSSVGIHKVKTWDQLKPAIEDAFLYDTKILIEQGIDAREIEVAVLEKQDGSLMVGEVSEIQASGGHEFYSYEAKYIDENGAKVELPAKISADQCTEVKRWGQKIFQALEISGFARVDFFLEKNTNNFYFNEINTIPGFTSISMYPKMMAAAGVQYPELLDSLIDVAWKKFQWKRNLKREK